MSVVVNTIRRGFYADSVALMRISRTLSAFAGVEEASLMIGSSANRDLLAGSGLLEAEGRQAQADDLIIALRAKDREAAEEALAEAGRLLSGGQSVSTQGSGIPTVRGFASAMATLPGANLALISVPGEFAAAEARRALERGLHVMMFSDNVPVADEISLKRLAVSKGLLLMGPDCGTALIGGAPIAFANVVPRGDIGLISASGTGLQEVSCLIARAGRGISHGIGVGGRDLSAEVGGLMTLAAFDALEADAATRQIVIVSKPPAKSVADAINARVARSTKPVTLCLLGAGGMTLTAAAEKVLGHSIPDAVHAPAPARKGWLRGLYSGGTLCNEAQIVLMAEGIEVASNVPVPGANETAKLEIPSHSLIDFGDDEYTRGRPHPMIDPEFRDQVLSATLADPGVAVVLLDVVIGHGAHPDPAGLIAKVVASSPSARPVIVASVTGTEADPQCYSRQVATLSAAGVIVAGSNAQAVRIASRVVSYKL
jgi:FdrA protein